MHGLMVSALVSGTKLSRFKPWHESVYCVLTLYSQSASLRPRCINGYHRNNAGDNPMNNDGL